MTPSHWSSVRIRLSTRPNARAATAQRWFFPPVQHQPLKHTGRPPATDPKALPSTFRCKSRRTRCVDLHGASACQILFLNKANSPLHSRRCYDHFGSLVSDAICSTTRTPPKPRLHHPKDSLHAFRLSVSRRYFSLGYESSARLLRRHPHHLRRQRGRTRPVCRTPPRTPHLRHRRLLPSLPIAQSLRLSHPRECPRRHRREFPLPLPPLASLRPARGPGRDPRRLAGLRHRRIPIAHEWDPLRHRLLRCPSLSQSAPRLRRGIRDAERPPPALLRHVQPRAAQLDPRRRPHPRRTQRDIRSLPLTMEGRASARSLTQLHRSMEVISDAEIKYRRVELVWREVQPMLILVIEHTNIKTRQNPHIQPSTGAQRVVSKIRDLHRLPRRVERSEVEYPSTDQQFSIRHKAISNRM